MECTSLYRCHNISKLSDRYLHIRIEVVEATKMLDLIYTECSLIRLLFLLQLLFPFKKNRECESSGQNMAKNIALQYPGTIALINSSLNPIVYFWRLSEIRKAIKKTLKCCYHRRVNKRQESKQRSDQASNI